MFGGGAEKETELFGRREDVVPPMGRLDYGVFQDLPAVPSRRHGREAGRKRKAGIGRERRPRRGSSPKVEAEGPAKKAEERQEAVEEAEVAGPGVIPEVEAVKRIAPIVAWTTPVSGEYTAHASVGPASHPICRGAVSSLPAWLLSGGKVSAPTHQPFPYTSDPDSALGNGVGDDDAR